MNESDIVLTPLPQADGATKNRPALLLRQMPPFGDFLACGISTQLHQTVRDFDETITHDDADFPSSGLLADSVIRLGFLAILQRKKIIGSIGTISTTRHTRLLKNLSTHLLENV
jgi:mRNA interferase MazF